MTIPIICHTIRAHETIMKKTISSVAIALMIMLTACSNGNNVKSSTFPNIEEAKIPDVLEIAVGTLGECYFSDGITDNSDYTSVLTATFNDTTEMEYTELMEHYKSASTGTGDNGSLIYDWGVLHVTTDDASISINALIR